MAANQTQWSQIMQCDSLAAISKHDLCAVSTIRQKSVDKCFSIAELEPAPYNRSIFSESQNIIVCNGWLIIIEDDESA